MLKVVALSLLPLLSYVSYGNWKQMMWLESKREGNIKSWNFEETRSISFTWSWCNQTALSSFQKIWLSSSTSRTPVSTAKSLILILYGMLVQRFGVTYTFFLHLICVDHIKEIYYIFFLWRKHRELMFGIFNSASHMLKANGEVKSLTRTKHLFVSGISRNSLADAILCWVNAYRLRRAILPWLWE